MIRPLIATVALLMSGAAGAAVPIFAAKCPNGVTADSDAKGRIYVSGKLAKVIHRPDGQGTAQSAGVYVDITPRGDQPPRITSTGRDKTVVVCEVVAFKAPDGAAAGAPPAGSRAVRGARRPGPVRRHRPGGLFRAPGPADASVPDGRRARRRRHGHRRRDPARRAQARHLLREGQGRLGRPEPGRRQHELPARRRTPTGPT